LLKCWSCPQSASSIVMFRRRRPLAGLFCILTPFNLVGAASRVPPAPCASEKGRGSGRYGEGQLPERAITHCGPSCEGLLTCVLTGCLHLLSGIRYKQ
jgi:hypothetical protein